ncbi:HdeD family acid-resistance protein [Streptomyces gilvus]|uniref:HdeD family acid-resistance protein n=1 Tax=Streptomyces gilvus TaxID=2920937 RepID=UPI001F0DA78F|nr:HdeD family acid-resistance protein [Streptomyces sp. CME 23]MCH5672022.1 HdeD family acid-resistance protein [Streptomyces sp. CME 23]
MTVSRGPAPRTGPEYPPGDPARPAPPGDPADVLAGLGGSWTWILGTAVATLVPGILVLVWPDETLHVLAVLIGLYLLVVGVFRFVAAFSRREHGERLPALLVAVLFVLAGVLCLRHPLQTVATLSLIVGAVWLVGGILTAYTALAARDLPHRGFVLGAAALACVAGILVLATPTASARALTRLLGVWLVLLGAAELALALAWRTALRRAAAAAPGLTRPG